MLSLSNRFQILITCALAIAATCACSHIEEPQLKPRLVVLTDIGPAEVEPDDNESAVRLMSYADRFEIEAIITSIGWNCDPYPPEWAEYLYRVIDAYGVDVHNLMKRSGQTGFKSLEEENGKQELGYWPSMEYVRSRAVMGSPRAGIGVIGPDNNTAGSDLLIKLADEDDPRPIYVCSWGGANTLSQAIWKVQQERSPEELKAFLNKFRLYTITDQDMVYRMRMNRAYSSHQWLRRDFSEYLWGVEGDTPSFLNAMPNGLNDPDHPEQVGWGGCHQFGISPDRITNAWTNWQDPLKTISNEYEHKFYPDEFNDFAARMQWADQGSGNHNPVVIVNGNKGIKPIEMLAKAGTVLRADASKSFDPDGDGLSFEWWFQVFPDDGPLPEISDPSAQKVSFRIPDDAAGRQLHLVCEVHDDGNFNLVAYRRVIINVK